MSSERFHLFGAGLGNMTGRAVSGSQLGQFGRDLRAFFDGQRAAPAEPAAGGGVDDPGRLAAIGPVSAIWPAYITIGRSATYRALAMSWVMYRMDTPSSSRSLAIRLSRPIRIDTSSIETGSSARISLGRMASAWAKPTRCRWPPLSS